MSDFDQVKKALESGADPAMLCMTCPWDRFCIQPPSMTRQDVDAKYAEAKAEDERKAREVEADGKKAGIPMGSLLTMLTLAGKDTSAQVCPVFAMRLRSGDGRKIVDGLRTQMTGWSESAS